jgi:oxygen-independent coproporphyrinogen-3 oxidase
MSHRKPSSRCSRSQTDPSGDIGVYVHIPFCLQKCSYCDFASEPLKEAGGREAARRYQDALAVEMDLRAASAEFSGSSIDTLYIGGGTPTILPSEWIAAVVERIAARFSLKPELEVTIEANPGTASEEGLAALVAAGVNRVSLGVQSFSDGLLQTLGRAHSVADAERAITAVRSAGCANLNLDLIYGMPGQSLEEWSATVEACVKARPQHIAAYALSVEPSTPLAQGIEAGVLPPPDEDLAADMYLLAAEVLAAARYHHYEISNFALPGCESEHNRRYWANAEYLGLGASAHSYRGAVRWNNLRRSGVYTEWLERGLLPAAEAEALSARRRVGETLMLGLRRAEGVLEDDIATRCGLAPQEVFSEEIRRLCDRGLLVMDGGALRIPRDKWLLSDEALALFAL